MRVTSKQLILSVILLCLIAPVFSQDSTHIEGRVLNSKDVPVEGVSVSVEGSSNQPYITGEDGYFSVTFPGSEAWLLVAPVDRYKNKEIFISEDDQAKRTIYLVDERIQAGNDDVLNLLGENKRKNQVTPLYTLEDRDYNRLPYITADQYFQGVIPGAFYTNHSGMPGSGGSLYLRGMTGLNSNNFPLVVVDGLPLENANIYTPLIDGAAYSPLSGIDPQDISNITVINGGTGSTLYGMKGSNGVILIETLKPTDIQTSIDFSFKTGIRLKGRQLPQLGAEHYKTLANEVLATSGLYNETFDDKYPGLYYTPEDEEYIRYSHDYTWQDEVFTNSVFQDAYLSVTGGDAVGKYGLSIGYYNHKGTFKNTGFDRFTARFVGSFNVFEWLRFNVSANLASLNSDIKESALSRQTNPILTSLFKSPLMFPYQYDDDGNQLSIIDNVDELGVSNPTAVMDLFTANNSNSRFLTSVRIEGDVSDAIKFNSLLGLNINSLRQTAFYPNQGMELYYSGEAYNVSKSLTSNLFAIYNDNYLSYNERLGEHRLSARAGAKWYTNSFEEDLALTKNSNPNDEYQSLQSGTAVLRNIGGGVYNWNWLSGYGAFNYAFRDKYIAEAAFSGDLSSKVGNEATGVWLMNGIPIGNFYSGGVAWRISEEPFLAGASTLEDLKLRAQYSISGNDDLGITSRHDYYRIALYRETSGMVPGGYGNPAIKHEEKRELTAGFDLAFKGDRYRLSMNYYRMNMEDMLVFEVLNPYVGYDIYPSNNASMRRSGIEMDLFARVIKTSDFSLDFLINATTSSNSITRVKDDQLVTSMPGYELVNQVGDPMNSYYGYEFKGVYSTTEEASGAGLVNDIGVPYDAGDAIYSDLSGPGGEPDGIINEYDKTVLGSASPDLFGGVTLRLSYGNWSLETLFQYVYGNELFNYIRYQNEKMTDISNQSITTLRRWSYEGQDTDMPRALWGDPMGNSDFSSRWIEDGSYIRWKTVTLSYARTTDFLVFKNFSVYASGINLLTFTRYLGYDPEFSASVNTAQQGVDYGLMPQARTFLLGVKLGL